MSYDHMISFYLFIHLLIIYKSKLPIECIDSNGYFIMPTIITNLNDSSPLMQEEIFGKCF